MSAEGVIVGSVTGVVVGIVTAYAMKNALDKVGEEARKAELEERESEGYKRGWEAAGNSRRFIRNRYQDLFDPKDEEMDAAAK